MTGRIDLNADLGEHDDWLSDEAEQERRLLPLVTTAHVACGYHAGNRTTMARMAEACRSTGVVLGAHPSYPDREGFGRRPMDRSAEKIVEDVTEQLGVLSEVAAAEGTKVRSVKAHGALYNRMAVDAESAAAVARSVALVDPTLLLVVPSTAVAEKAVAGEGLATVVEGFCDRAYRADGTLAPRGEPDAVLTDPLRAAAQAVALASGRPVRAVDGSSVRIRCQTLCLHGDTPGAIATAEAVRERLRQAGVSIAPIVPPS